VTNGKETAGPPPHPEDAVAWSKPPKAASKSRAQDQAEAEPADGHDLTKQDYAHTTSGTPDHTALIPVIRDEPVGAAVASPASAHVNDEPKHAAPAVAENGGPAASPVSGGRTAGLRLVRVEPYSVTRLAFVVSVALMIVSVVAVAIFWIMLAVTGVWGQINDSVASLLSDDSASFDIKDYVGFGRVVGGTLVLSGINVILMTGLATVGAHLYNLAAALLGGVEATFTDE
jgi:hypothetical protein